MRGEWVRVLIVLATTAIPGCSKSVGPFSARDLPRPTASAVPAAVAVAAEADAEERAAWSAPLPFRLPRGYVAERVAAGPLVKHPMFAAFDDRGGLYVAGSSGHGGDAIELSAKPADVIRRLEDTDGDGRFDRSTVFADGLTFPQGVLWHEGAVYTASPPSLWKLEDTDGDGVADRRTELVTGFPFTGIADDLHGPCLGPDGRIYWGVGRFAYAIRRPRGPVIRRGQAPLVLRSRPDGESIEVFGGAMGNPVEMAFGPSGEVFVSGTFLNPESQGAGLRDALIHCVDGGLFSVRDRDLSGETHTSGLLPPMAQLGVAAAAGMARARGGPFGDDAHLTLYAALFNLHDVPRFTLRLDGATFRALEEPFLESDEPDFHPTDVLEDADGSLLIVDTGGWFVHCPTSQIDKPHVFGGIYRVRRADVKRPDDPRGLGIGWDRLPASDVARLLGDARFAVRDRAAAVLARGGTASVGALAESLRDGTPLARLGAVWALARIEDDGARATVRGALQDPDESVRTAAANVAGLHRDLLALPPLRGLATADPAAGVRRQAVAALGRLGRPEAVPSLLEQLRGPNDRFLEHTLIYSLIRVGDPAGVRPGLLDPSPAVRRGALIALDQMADGGLTPHDVLPMLDPAHPDLRRAAVAVVVAHPEWAAPMAENLRRWLIGGPDGVRDLGRLDGVRQQLLAFAPDPAVRLVISEALGRDAMPAVITALLLEVVASTPSKDWPAAWASAVTRGLADADERVTRQAVLCAGAAASPEFADALLVLARDARRSLDLRTEALDVAAPRLKALEPPLFDFLVARLDPDANPLRRLTASRALGRAPLNDDQLRTLAAAAGRSGALVLPNLLPAFERSRDAKAGAALVAALNKAPGRAAVSPVALQTALRHFPYAIRRRARRLIHRLDGEQSDRAARLAEVLSSVDHGDSARGREVFFGARVACSTCHTVRGEGGHVGPDLTRIGEVRSSRDLLEAILFPSASFARGYEPVTVATDDGLVYNGVVLRETGDAIRLVTADCSEVSLPRDKVEAMERGRVSVMPQGLDANLSRGELADLVAFLRSLH
jgi:putative membrane-bound dehydrogenase-like protein